MAFSVSGLVEGGVETIGSVSMGVLTAAGGSTEGTGTSLCSTTTAGGGKIDSTGSSLTGPAVQTGGSSTGSVLTGVVGAAASPVLVRNRFGCLSALVDDVGLGSVVERRLMFSVITAAGSRGATGAFSSESDVSIALPLPFTCCRLLDGVSFFAGRLPLAPAFVVERDLTGSGPSRGRLAPIRSLSCIVSGLSVSSSLNGGFPVFAAATMASGLVAVLASLSSVVSSSSFFDGVRRAVDCRR